MSWRMGWSVALRLAAGLAAIVFTAASSLYAPIGLGTQSPAGMEVRTQAVWVLLVASAAATWLVAIRPALRSPRLLSSATAGFNLIWIFSFAGPPVVLASLAAICAATVGPPSRLTVAGLAAAISGLVLGLIFLLLTEPPGEHLFG